MVAYKAGSVFAGGSLLWFREKAGWGAMFGAFAALYFISVGLFRRYRLTDRSTAEGQQQSHEQEAGDETRTSRFSWSEVLSVEGTLPLVCFVGFYKLCERAEQTFSLYLVDKGVSASHLALWATVVRSASLAGSAHGGALLSFAGGARGMTGVGERARSVLIKYAFARTVPILGQLAVILAWGKERYVRLEDSLGGILLEVSSKFY